MLDSSTRARLAIAAALAVFLAGCGGTAVDPSATTSATASVKQLRGPDQALRDLIGFRVRYRDLLRRHGELVRTIRVPYRAWDGSRRMAGDRSPRCSFRGEARTGASPCVHGGSRA